MRRLTLLIALLTGACAEMPLNQNGPSSVLDAPAATSGPHALVPAATLATTITGLAVADSCSDGSVPTILPPGTHDNSATLMWRGVAGIRDYGWEIERMDVTNVLLPVAAFVVNDQTTVTVTLGAGTYYARIRARNGCGGFGPWSAKVVFSVDEGEPVPAIAASPSQPSPSGPPSAAPQLPTCHESSSADDGNQHQICG